jgi:cytochrome c
MRRNVVVQNGQLFKGSVLAAFLVCCGPTLADRDYPTNDVDASYGKTYAGDLQVCSNHATDDGSGPAVFSWLVELYKEVPLVGLSPLEGNHRAVPVRANVCLKHALTGEPLPIHSQSMQDIIDHCGLLGAGPQPRYAYQQGAGRESSGLSEFDIALIRQFDPKLYQDHCTGCHMRH